MTLQLVRHRFTIDDFHDMAEAGILHEDDRVELIDGEIIEMCPIGSHHAASVDALAKRFILTVPDEITVRIQNPVSLSMHSEPEPDIMLLRPREIPYSEEHPTPEDVLLIVEIGDSSVELDARVKQPLYAAATIPEVWLGNLKRKGVSRHAELCGGRYTKVERFGLRADISPLALPDVPISLSLPDTTRIRPWGAYGHPTRYAHHP